MMTRMKILTRRAILQLKLWFRTQPIVMSNATRLGEACVVGQIAECVNADCSSQNNA